MKLYRMIALALTFALLITPSLAEFKGKQGEKATYESLINGAAQGTAVYSTEGKFRIGNTETRKFSISDSTGSRVEGYLDNNGKPIKVDYYTSNQPQSDMSVAFDYQRKVATITYKSQLPTANTSTVAPTQTMNVNITSNQYDATFITQSLRHLPLAPGYKASFQLFNAPIAIFMTSMAPLLTMMGVTLDPTSMAVSNSTLQVSGRENIKVGNSTYDCYKVIMEMSQEMPPQLAAIDPSLTSQKLEQQLWFRTSDLLLVRAYSEETTTAPSQTNAIQTTQQKTTYETRLINVTYG